MDSDIEQKQNLLKEEIIDKNYDQEQFIQFCLVKKENGDDLTQWSLTELHDIIGEFKKNQEEHPVTSQPSEEKVEQKKAEENLNNDIQNIKMAKTKVEDKTTTTIVINCKK